MTRPLLHTAAILMLTGSLMACDPDASDRDCGVFDHPGLAEWQTQQVAGTEQFMGSNGSLVMFTRSAVALNVPFTQSLSVENSEDVTCFLSATSRLDSTAGDLAFVTRYVQEENVDQASADERLSVITRIESPIGTPTNGDFRAGLGGPEDQITTFVSNTVSFLGDQIVGGVPYRNAISINSLDLSGSDPDAPPEAADFIQQLIYANEFGLVSFTDRDGIVFNRVPN